MRVTRDWLRQFDPEATLGARKGVKGALRPSQEDALALHIRAAGLPEPNRQHRFHVERQWRFDFAWPERLIAVEVEGMVVRRVNGRTQLGGRHATITGLREDCRKYNAAGILGWRVLRFTQDMVKSGEAIRTIEAALAA